MIFRLFCTYTVRVLVCYVNFLGGSVQLDSGPTFGRIRIRWRKVRIRWRKVRIRWRLVRLPLAYPIQQHPKQRQSGQQSLRTDGCCLLLLIRGYGSGRFFTAIFLLISPSLLAQEMGWGVGAFYTSQFWAGLIIAGCLSGGWGGRGRNIRHRHQAVQAFMIINVFMCVDCKSISYYHNCGKTFFF